MSEDSSTEIEAADMMHCASCGKAEIDDIKLKDCDGGCDLARYCSDDCKQDHLEKHEATCEERAAEIRDEILFRQPESSHFGDCPICFLPVPLDPTKSCMHTCCGKVICVGCAHSSFVREVKERLKHRCPFCRKPADKNDEEGDERLTKRAEANDPVGLGEIGMTHYKKGDYDKAFEYWTRAADLGDAISHYNLALAYQKGEGVEEDGKMMKYHLEEAAIAGHPGARYKLGFIELNNERVDIAVKHLIIAANLGDDESLQTLKTFYKHGDVSKDDLAAVFRAHQAAVDATKSPQREAANARLVNMVW